MMPNITRGTDTAGLVRYLFGPGRANEHTDPRIVAAYEGFTAEGEPRFEGGSPQLAAVAADLDSPHALFGTTVKDGHVWHCSISLRSDDGPLTDEQWATVAGRMVEDMGFANRDGKAPCRWIAVHHGTSTKGNDHIHLVVDLVREDGSKADVFRDHPRSQQICAAIELDMGLSVVEGRRGRSTPGIKRGEQEAAARRGHFEPERHTLARRVRAAGATSRSEAEFVRNLRASGVIARPRYAKGGRSEVVGYSVALHIKAGDHPPLWFPGGKLARDLTLTQLRQQWPDTDPADAVAVWSERSDALTERGAPNDLLRDETAWEMAAQQISEVRARLAQVPTDDVVRWSQAAYDAAGVMAVLSARLEERPGPLAKAADVLARSAQRSHEDRHRPMAVPPGQLRGAAMAARYSRSNAASALGQALMLQAMRNTMRALHDLHKARQERQQAAEIARSAQGDLARLQHSREWLASGPGSIRRPGGQVERPGPENGPQVQGPDRDR
ncbi:relaxase/mobilization nuclease domain-containing protein [Streptomyces sp. NBC_01431]|uniref:relaxase/mobilization nuclease domain-containing protein n=1 Tax=Streptomyces sp. NBC_01431 TaxID=2903863 RepID=UPI002E376C2C|nr:relaxase/mobilization nuclease domain-containing protein [Streptomyces sp. NBC_01431]